MSDPENVPVNHAKTETPDPHGNAALLLVESLIHGLCEKSLLSTGEAIDIVERAVEVQAENLTAADGADSSIQRSHTLLSSIASSLQRDDFDDPMPPIMVQ
ncbi:hypothetical protein M3P36_07215 [Altererythrobacter sp. KTW20L]|uniref:hypothetical protein n=1 Tax=Altererythrobacter sp. KTW20L TaxID=2942210 RepID=UPI0020C0E93B|nr:hypothetical protein [Altererythrobacter sp. KTW20L]MCL6250832.1 hypothetical protein [Altererythrobacter sp. KTW20L]